MVEEFANICAYPVHKTFLSKNGISLTKLFNLLHGAAYANFWLILEDFNNLPLEMLSILNKEIQLIQQKFIIADLFDDNEIGEEIFLKNVDEEDEEDDIEQGIQRILQNDPATGETEDEISEGISEVHDIEKSEEVSGLTIDEGKDNGNDVEVDMTHRGASQRMQPEEK